MTNLKVLIQKLSPACRLALENSANLCLARMHHQIEIEHFFIELLKQGNNDLALLCQRFNTDALTLGLHLEQQLEYLARGNQQMPVFSISVIRLLEQAWLLASIESASYCIRSGHLVVALLTVPELYQLALRCSSLFEQFPVDSIKHKLSDYCLMSIEQETTSSNATSVENQTLDQSSSDQSNSGNLSTAPKTATPALDQFTVNLTQKAKNGEIDPVIGREVEIRQMMDILMRRRQNNPILTGEAGVGKTAVVEGLALKISQNLVPQALNKVHIHTLDMGLLQAGASVKGEFENRLKNVIREINESAHAIILFIDEAHTIIGAGGQAGQNDAANLLKPALARGQLRTIAATTWSEYKQYFEKDAALSRRFQVIKIEEPTVEVAVQMLRAMVPVMSQHFNVDIDEQAIFTAVQASHRYMMGRQLPDKAVSVLDTATARVALSQSAKPAQLDVLEARKHNLNLELELLLAEQQALHHSPLPRLETVGQQLDFTNQQINEITQQWQAELQLITQLKQLQQQLPLKDRPDHSQELLIKQEISQLRQRLKQLQHHNPLVHERVNEHIVSQIIADWTGIPLGKMQADDITAVLNLQEKLEKRVMGQSSALYSLAQGIKTARARLEDPNKPQGVFLLVGPSGVGKTETALALADELYGGENYLISINMSEYQEAHTVSALKGAPPGYVGYGQGGILTEAVRRNPYSVILLDEIEKAHQDVQELFYQVFDKGTLEDGEGRLIDFKNCLILLTSNVGSSVIMQQCINKPVEDWPNEQQLVEALLPALYKNFKPAFLGRMRLTPYFPLHDDLLIQIIEHKLAKIATRMLTQHQTSLGFSSALVELVLSRCTEVDSGARNIDHILNSSVLPDLATHLLTAMVDGTSPQHIFIDIDANDQLTYQVDFPTPTVNTINSSKTDCHKSKSLLNKTPAIEKMA